MKRIEGAAATDHDDDQDHDEDDDEDEDAGEVLKLEALPNTQPPGLPLTTSPSLPSPSLSLPCPSACLALPLPPASHPALPALPHWSPRSPTRHPAHFRPSHWSRNKLISAVWRTGIGQLSGGGRGAAATATSSVLEGAVARTAEPGRLGPADGTQA